MPDLYAIEQLIPDVVLDGDWELVRCSRGRVVTSPSVDKSLDRPVVLDPDQYSLPPDLAVIKPAVLAQSGTTQLFDGLNVALCEDPDPSGSPIHLRRVRYFDMLASNYLGGQVWLSRDSGRVVADLTRHLIADDGRLRPLSATELGNQVGVSTIALTTDGWMVLVHQSASSHSSPGLVAPSGSGCLEPQDVEGRDRLTDVVAAGMERELREELGLVSAAMREVRLETTVLRYGRWLEKGAKPEFYGFSRIHAAMRDLDVRIDASEREFVTEHVRITPADVRRLAAGEPFESLGRGVPSVPLELCLARLQSLR